MDPVLAEVFLAALTSTPNSAPCPDCARADLGIEKWDVMKLLRDLIAQGRVLCDYGYCTRCGTRDFIIRVRRPPFSE